MQHLLAINFPDDKTKLDWLRRFAVADKATQQQMAEDAAKQYPMLDSTMHAKQTVN